MDCPLPQNRFLRGIYLMIQRYLRHNVGIQSAALAFYLLFTLFPLMIFISALLGLLDLNVAGILEALREILPLEILEFIGVYLTYVGENPSPQLLLFGLCVLREEPPVELDAQSALLVTIGHHLGLPRRSALLSLHPHAGEHSVDGLHLPVPGQQVLVGGGAQIRIGVEQAAGQSLHQQGAQPLRLQRAAQLHQLPGAPGLAHGALEQKLPQGAQRPLVHAGGTGGGDQPVQHQGEDVLLPGQRQKGVPLRLPLGPPDGLPAEQGPPEAL